MKLRPRPLTDNQILLLYLGLALLFLLIINRWFWPTPDEYLYASVARSILAGFQGKICLSCFNTEHTYLVPAISALYQWLLGADFYDLIGSRIPNLIISVATIYVIWLIAGRVVRQAEERTWWLWLLLLIPGYFVLSVRFLLDVPLIFGFALLIYGLIIKTRPIWLGLALLIILVTKDYGFYLAWPLIVLHFMLEFFNQSSSLFLRVKQLVGQIGVSLLPSVAIVVLLLGFHVLPYPRLLETGLREYTDNIYPFVSKQTLAFMKIGSEQLAELSLISPEQVQQTTELSEKVNQFRLFGSGFPTAIIDSPLKPQVTGGFIRKLWLIYQYNFSEQDVMIFVLPLFLTGLVMRIRQLVQLGRQWYQDRVDVIFLAFTAIFFFVNWHEALNIHGFRLTAPITLSLIYFSYFGARLILLKGTRLAKLVFSVAFVLFAVLYANFILNVSYGSVIATQSVVATLLKFKLPISMTIFLVAFVFMLVYSRLRWSGKQYMLVSWIIFLFFLKFWPFFLEARAAQRHFEFDFGLPKASPLLEQQRLNKKRVITNINPYTLDYYAGELNLSTESNYPLLRSFSQDNRSVFTHQLERLSIDPARLYHDRVSYVFYVHKLREEKPDSPMWQSLLDQSNYFQLVSESRHNDRIQWQLYQFDVGRYVKDSNNIVIY